MATRMQKNVDVNEIEEVNVKQQKKKKFANDDYIMCHSITIGSLNVKCPSGAYYEFKSYGSDCEITYHDLATLVRKGSEHIFKPRFVIDDKDFLSEFPQVIRVYEKMYTKEDLLEILNLPVANLEAAIAELPDNVKGNLRNMIATEIGNGNIDSVRTIRELSRIFNSDFNLLSELFIR